MTGNGIESFKENRGPLAKQHQLIQIVSVVLFWPQFKRALLASLSLVNVSLSCLHSIHFVSLHSPSQYLSCLHSSNPFLGFGIFGGFGQCLLPCLHSSYFIPLHSPSKFLSNNEKKKLFSFSFIQATLCNFFPLLRTCALLTVGICFRKKCFLHLFLYPVDLSAI